MNKSKIPSNKIKVFIGSDHGGYEMKQAIKNDKNLNQYLDFIDVGTYSNQSVDYPDYAEKIAQNVIKNPNSYGIGICGTGIGICISLNKIKGIYAAKVNDKNEAQLAKAHNNVNVITLSGRFKTLKENIEIINSFFKTKFESGRHQNRINKIIKLETKQNG